MRKLLYLHGHGSNIERSLSNRSIVDAISDQVIAFNAPFATDEENSFKWFSLDREDDANVMGQIQQSCDFIKNKLADAHVDELELTLFGNSQGAFMVLYLTLNNIIVPKKAIAAVPFYMTELVADIKNKTTPILWMAGGHDTVIPADLGVVWHDLVKNGANLDFRLDPESEHGVWTENMVNEIIKWSKSK